MQKNRMNLLCVIAGLTILLSPMCRGQYFGPTVQQNPPMPGKVAAENAGQETERLIQPGDILAVYVYGMPEMSAGLVMPVAGTQQVNGVQLNGFGEVVLPFVGRVRLGGMTQSQAVAELRKKLVESGLLVDPVISISIVDSPGRIISVIGEVTRPSQVKAYDKIRLLDAIAFCGGFTGVASHVVTVQREGRQNSITVDLGTDPEKAGDANLFLQPGDTIVVAKEGGIYVVGEVRNAAMYMAPGNAPLTVMGAIAMSGGLKFSAALAHARIYRVAENQQRVQINFNLKKLMYGKQKDITLAANDILFIPSNAWKASLAAGGVSAAESILYGATYAEATLK